MPWRLRTTFRTFTITLITTIGAAVLSVAWIDGIASVRESAQAVIEEIAQVVETEVSEHLEVPDRALQLMSQMMGDGALDSSDLQTLQAVFTDFIDTHPEVSALQYRRVDGKRLEVLRDTDGKVRAYTDDIIESAKESEWYDRWLSDPQSNESVASAFWGGAMVRHDLGVPAVTGSRPVVDSEGKTVGVVAVEVSLVDVSRFMATLKIGSSGECFVVDSEGHLIAVADSTSFLRPQDAENAITFHQLDFPHRAEIRAFGRRPEVSAMLSGAGAPVRIRFLVEGDDYLGSLGRVEPSPEGGWFVGVIVPENDFLGELKQTILTGLGLLILVMIAALFMGDWFSRYLARSLAGGVDETEHIQMLNFDSRGKPTAAFRELHDVLLAFESMKVGIRSFSRYVPVNVVKRLIESGNDARSGGELRPLTICFCDIADFTTLSEGVDPDRLTEKLNAYFAGVGRAIDDCGGRAR